MELLLAYEQYSTIHLFSFKTQKHRPKTIWIGFYIDYIGINFTFEFISQIHFVTNVIKIN